MMGELRKAGDLSGDIDDRLEQALCSWGKAHRQEPVPDLWRKLRRRVLEAERRRPDLEAAAFGRIAVSALASLAASYLLAPWLYGVVSYTIPHLVGRAAAVPARAFTAWGGWWESVLVRALGGF